MKKIWALALVTLAATLILVGCGANKNASETKTVKLGVVGANNEIWEDVASRLKNEGINLELVEFSDYNQPNAALVEKEVDLTSHQTQIFMEAYNRDHNTTITSIGNTINAPLGIYSNKIKNVSELKKGDKIAIPNDPSNDGRSLILLQTAGLIKVDPSKGNSPTVSDITENKLDLELVEVDANQTARVLDDVACSVINVGMAVDAGFTPAKDAIYREPLDDASKPYVNVISARSEDVDNKTYQKIVAAYQQEDTKKVIEETSKGSYVPAWEKFGKK